ncbi:hypothetical protein GGR52DRAFT_166616 [Hypoxylon sp. FL1284]|nr:hypothetical protein GGR52DRAFT_166616 [Hypoxylon sp. FL1284]
MELRKAGLTGQKTPGLFRFILDLFHLTPPTVQLHCIALPRQFPPRQRGQTSLNTNSPIVALVILHLPLPSPAFPRSRAAPRDSADAPLGLGIGRFSTSFRAADGSLHTSYGAAACASGPFQTRKSFPGRARSSWGPSANHRAAFEPASPGKCYLPRPASSLRACDVNALAPARQSAPPRWPRRTPSRRRSCWALPPPHPRIPKTPVEFPNIYLRVVVDGKKPALQRTWDCVCDPLERGQLSDDYVYDCL